MKTRRAEQIETVNLNDSVGNIALIGSNQSERNATLARSQTYFHGQSYRTTGFIMDAGLLDDDDALS